MVIFYLENRLKNEYRLEPPLTDMDVRVLIKLSKKCYPESVLPINSNMCVVVGDESFLNMDVPKSLSPDSKRLSSLNDFIENVEKSKTDTVIISYSPKDHQNVESIVGGRIGWGSTSRLENDVEYAVNTFSVKQKSESEVFPSRMGIK